MNGPTSKQLKKIRESLQKVPVYIQFGKGF